MSICSELSDHCFIDQEYLAPYTTDEVINTWETIAERFSEYGAHVSQVSLPSTEYSIACYSILNTCEVASNMARYDGIEYGKLSSRLSSSYTD